MIIPPKKGRKISYTYSPAGFASITTISFSELGVRSRNSEVQEIYRNDSKLGNLDNEKFASESRHVVSVVPVTWRGRVTSTTCVSTAWVPSLRRGRPAPLLARRRNGPEPKSLRPSVSRPVRNCTIGTPSILSPTFSHVITRCYSIYSFSMQYLALPSSSSFLLYYVASSLTIFETFQVYFPRNFSLAVPHICTT